MIEFWSATGSGLLVIFIGYISRVIFLKYKRSQSQKNSNKIKKPNTEESLYKKRSKESYVDSFNKLLVFFCNQADSYYNDEGINENSPSYEVTTTSASMLKNSMGFDPEWLNLNDKYKLLLNFNYPPRSKHIKSKTESNIYIRFLPFNSDTQTHYLNIFYVFKEDKPQLLFTYNAVTRSGDSKTFKEHMKKYGKEKYFNIPKLNDEKKEQYYDTFNDLISHSLKLSKNA